MLGGQLGGLINARLELRAQGAPAGHVIAQHQQQPEVQGWAHPATAVIPTSQTVHGSLRATEARPKACQCIKDAPKVLQSLHPLVLQVYKSC